MCEVVNIKNAAFDIYIGRHSDKLKGKWGNPYCHKTEGTLAQFKTASRKEAVESFEIYLLSNTELLNSLHELQGKVLGCWCHPKLCHGHILKKYVDRLEKGIPLTLF